ncbi:MAG: TonB family protein, partial [Deltaproteobacteria bacterium]|nr:TonB family protein [Deltaproteobacteria bacterium]
GLGGKVVIRWTINASGKVIRAKVSKTSMKNGRVEDCIVRQVLRMQFPKPKGGSKAVVNYPFVFAQQ